ncbi:hypothetical protein X975_06891, partial [Stegodyphus mimosarum]
MRQFQKILYSTDKEEAKEAYESALEAGKFYPVWQLRLQEYWNIRNMWCLAWRETTCRGHHTNNFTEVAVRIFKDNVLSRVKTVCQQQNLQC